MSLQTTPATLGNKLLNFSAADVKVKEGKASNPHFAQSLGNICMLYTDFISVLTSFLQFHNDCFAPHKNLISLLLIYPTTIVFSSRKVYSGTCNLKQVSKVISRSKQLFVITGIFKNVTSLTYLYASLILFFFYHNFY